MTNAEKEELRSRNPIIDVVGQYVELKRKGNWMMGCCPFHEETTPSFAIKIGGNYASCFSCGWNGDVFKFVRSMKNCTFPEALKILSGGRGGVGASPVRREGKASVKHEKKPPKMYDHLHLAELAIWEMLKREYNQGGRWEYTDKEGTPVAYITRWNKSLSTKKEFRPITVTAQGFYIGKPESGYPIYNLPAILKSWDETVFLVEGEKCANAVNKLGLLATTTPHGANGIRCCDLAPLAGRNIIIIPDNDEPGMKYAETIKESLLKLTPRPKVSIFKLSGLEPKEDIYDWIEARSSSTKTEVIEMLRQEYKRGKKHG